MLECASGATQTHEGTGCRELHDIGIAHGDIEYVASHPEIDPRGI
jgi:uncharacterized protein YjiS (DUF1127 family)